MNCTWLSSSTTTISDCKRLTMIPFTSDIPARSMPRRGRLALPDALGQSDREPRGDEQLRAQRLGLRICGLFEATSQMGVHLSTQKRQRAHRSGSSAKYSLASRPAPAIVPIKSIPEPLCIPPLACISNVIVRTPNSASANTCFSNSGQRLWLDRSSASDKNTYSALTAMNRAQLCRTSNVRGAATAAIKRAHDRHAIKTKQWQRLPRRLFGGRVCANWIRHEYGRFDKI
jgi:hypothetical protein